MRDRNNDVIATADSKNNTDENKNRRKLKQKEKP